MRIFCVCLSGTRLCVLFADPRWSLVSTLCTASVKLVCRWLCTREVFVGIDVVCMFDRLCCNGAGLLAQLLEFLEGGQANVEVDISFINLFHDVRETVDRIHRNGTLKVQLSGSLSLSLSLVLSSDHHRRDQ